MADGFILFPPQGRSVGAIRVQDRLRPLRSVRSLVDQSVAEMGTLISDIEVGRLTRLITAEGEHGAEVTVSGRRRADGQRVERTLGLVFAEDSYSRVDGIMQLDSELEGFRARVRAVTTKLSLGLGALRRRWFLYHAPDGWQGVAKTFRSDWVPAEYPRDAAMIQVLHARPMVRGAGVSFERALREDLGAGLVIEAQTPDEVIGNRQGLGGLLSSLTGHYPDGPRLHVRVAALTDERFLYIVRLETGEARFDEHRLAFDAVVESVTPLPQPAGESMPTAVDAHWAT